VFAHLSLEQWTIVLSFVLGRLAGTRSSPWQRQSAELSFHVAKLPLLDDACTARLLHSGFQFRLPLGQLRSFVDDVQLVSSVIRMPAANMPAVEGSAT